MKRTIIFPVILLCVILGGRCSRSENKKISPVILISIDTCRADRLGCYGYSGGTTPRLDALAEEGVVFENAVAPVPLTLPSHSTMLCGTDPTGHGVHDNTGYHLAAHHQTLAELFRQKGRVTGAVVSAYVMDSRFGLAQGFDTYDDRFGSSENITERPGGETTDLAVRWLSGHRDDPFFLFIHYYDPHTRYNPPEPFKTKFRKDPYNGEIAYVDDCIGRIIAHLKKIRLYDAALIVVTSDHGEMLGEHGEDSHGFFIYRSALRVPLIFKLPFQKRRRRIRTLAGLTDVLPTVCGLTMMECPEEAAGRDLFSPIGAQENQVTDPAYYCESYLPALYGADPLRGIVTGEWKYIRSPQPELYRISGDPAEAVNLYSQKSEMARTLDDRLAEIIRRGRRHRKNDRSSESKADAGTLKKLESLGYIGGVSPKKPAVSDTGLDPKAIIGYHMNHIRVKMIFSQPGVSPEDLRRGEAICREMLADQPDLWPAHHYLGRIYVKMGNNRLGQKNITGAMDCFSRAIESNRNQMEAYNNLAWIMATHPDPRYRNGDRAVAYAEKAVSLGKGKNPSLLGTLAAAHAETGQFDRAVTVVGAILSRSDIDTYGTLVDLWKGQLKMYVNRHPYRDTGLK